jgi:hypothetical protein
VFSAGESVIPGEPSTSSVKRNKQTIAANVEGIFGALVCTVFSKAGLVSTPSDWLYKGLARIFHQ